MLVYNNFKFLFQYLWRCSLAPTECHSPVAAVSLLGLLFLVELVLPSFLGLGLTQLSNAPLLDWFFWDFVQVLDEKFCVNRIDFGFERVLDALDDFNEGVKCDTPLFYVSV